MTSPESFAHQERQAIVAHFNNFLQDHANPDGTIGQLRPDQTTTLLKIRDFIASSGELDDDLTRHGLLELSCGYGKTALMAYTSSAMGAGKQRVDGKRRQISIATSRDILVNQLSSPEELRQGLRYFANNLDISTYNRFDKDYSGDVVILPYPSLISAAARGHITNDFSAHLLDEAHHVGTARGQAIRDLGKSSIVLGFTATGRRLGRLLPTTIDKVTMAEGILKYDFLCGIRLYGAGTNQVFIGHGNEDYVYDALRPLAESTDRNQRIVSIAQYGVSALGSGLIRCIHGHKQEHARYIADLINDSGPVIDTEGVERKIRAEAVGSHRPDSPEVVEAFRNTNEIDILTGVKYFNEGLDVSKIAWGIYGVPTMSLDSLEQFLGRGARHAEGRKDKIFTAFQFIDIDLGLSPRQAFFWDLFGQPGVVQGFTVQKSKHTTWPPTPVEPASVPPELQDIVGETKNPLNLILEVLGQPTSSEDTTHSLLSLHEQTGIPTSWLHRIFFHAGISAKLALNKDSFAEPFYPERTKSFIDTEVALPTDMTYDDVCEAIGVSKTTVVNKISEYGIEPRDVYRRTPGKVTRRQPHLSAEQFDALVEKLGIRQPLNEDEIGLQEILDRTGITTTSMEDFFRMRGYWIDVRLVKGESGRPRTILKRAEIEPWIKSYAHAPPLPENGYTSVYGYSQRVFSFGRVTYPELFKAIRQLGIEVRHFALQGKRGEYFESRYKEQVDQLLIEMAADSAATTTTPAETPDIAKPAEDMPAAANEDLATGVPKQRPSEVQPSSHTPRTNLRPGPATRVTVGQEAYASFSELSDTSGLNQQVLKMAAGDLGIEPENIGGYEVIPRALTTRLLLHATTKEQARPASSSLGTIPVKNLMEVPDRNIVTADRDQRITSDSILDIPKVGNHVPFFVKNISQVARSRNQPLPLYLAVLQRQRFSKKPEILQDNDGDVWLQNDPGFNTLREIVTPFAKTLPRFSPGWVFADDIAHLVGVSSVNLCQSIVRNNIPDKYVKATFISEAGGALVFCAPGLTRRIIESYRVIGR